MSLPRVVITRLDGQLGNVPSSSGAPLAILGPASAGVLNTPQGMARPKQITDAFTSGPMPEFATFFTARYGRTCIPVRTASSTAGTAGNLDVTGVTGSSVATIHASPTPQDDLDVVLLVVLGGTIATGPITLQYSTDGGRTMSPNVSLGTANHYIVPGTGTQIDFAAGTLITGDVIKFTTVAPTTNATDLHTALQALKNATLDFEGVLFAMPITAALFDQIETDFSDFETAGKFRVWWGNAAMPTPGESEADYKTAVDTVFSSKATTRGSIYAGDAVTSSAITGNLNRRPAVLSAASREASVSEEVNIMDLDLGPLPGVTITDANGNPQNHDESVNPGLDDSRYGTLRTWSNRNGVYVTRPRVLSSAGSDFTIMPYSRVMALFCETLLFYMQRRLGKPIRVSKKTGFITEADAVEIERGALKVLEAALTQKPKASGVSFTLSRTDDILGTKTLTGDGRVIPLGYAEFINLTLGFVNPALTIVQV